MRSRGKFQNRETLRVHYFALQERRIPGKIFPNVSRPFLRFLKWVLNGRKCTGNNAKGGDLRGGNSPEGRHSSLNGLVKRSKTSENHGRKDFSSAKVVQNQETGPGTFSISFSYRRRRVAMDQAGDVSLFVVPGVNAIGLQFYLGWI